MKNIIVLCFLAIAGSAFASTYDSLVLADNPVLYLPLSASSSSNSETDRSGKGRNGSYLPASHSPAKTRMPNGDQATIFDGYTEYLEVKSHRDFSVRRGGALTIETWIRPDTLQFPNDEGDGYVHFAGKGESGEHEYVFRMYSKQNSANRPNRISDYVFNLAGGLGSGSYFQDTVIAGKWIHVAMVVNTRVRPTVISIYKNGVLRKTTPLSQFNVVPQAGEAPLRIGTRDFGSFFKGAMGKFAVYAYPLTETRLKARVSAMGAN